jgi:hypothetical protein
VRKSNKVKCRLLSAKGGVDDGNQKVGALPPAVKKASLFILNLINHLISEKKKIQNSTVIVEAI